MFASKKDLKHQRDLEALHRQHIEEKLNKVSKSQIETNQAFIQHMKDEERKFFGIILALVVIVILTLSDNVWFLKLLDLLL